MSAVHTDAINDEVAGLLRQGGIGILRTDTLYGIVASARNEAAVERVYAVKGRTPTKPPIILIASTDQLLNAYDNATLARLKTLWPGRVSVILPAPGAPTWLVRLGDSLAYRMPDSAELRDLLEHTGPLIAPSANPEGLPPAMSLHEAVAYFGEKVDFYVDGGVVEDDTPSRLYRLLDDGMERLR
ncbi:L-threonylcarbamoyladenylate synthase [Streptomyces caniscabiei]|uniref:L-threonylcarbamoyladenylate synthase n=1 Tax=Streptomyces caniscabiei TaxID=2746961 RepID=UPI0029B0180B|nr:L-threonylcarbamoyladenylate synthase [Streptomyces caniscabiei]MDX2776476.1 L-threonylcarbamoyladenylate synthase [Streptomyces caniscabiei]